MSEQNQKKHNLILENRKNLSLGGIDDVLGFNEEMVTLSGSCGILIVRGENLHISKLSLETGEVSLDGKIDGLIYSEDKKEKSGVFSRLFK
ncbi:MAG: sporulation protein YabP [Oscillospiraceae bacterium]|nr:sporulation protein YabP [Oscillospiraceae bacterium]